MLQPGLWGESPLPSKVELICGDSLDSRVIRENSIDLIITSPPYGLGVDYAGSDDNITYDEWINFSEKWIKNCLLWSKDTGRMCVNVPLDKNKDGKHSVGSDIIQIAKKIGWKYQSTIIWNEQNISKRTAWGSWLSASAPYVIAPVELIVIFYKNEWKKNFVGVSDINKEEFIEWTNGLWTFSGENPKKFGHPAPYPIELPTRLIKLFSYIGDMVLDPFCGSGTTIAAAVARERRSIGVDICQQYIDITKKRILDLAHPWGAV